MNIILIGLGRLLGCFSRLLAMNTHGKLLDFLHNLIFVFVFGVGVGVVTLVNAYGVEMLDHLHILSIVSSSSSSYASRLLLS